MKECMNSKFIGIGLPSVDYTGATTNEEIGIISQQQPTRSKMIEAASRFYIQPEFAGAVPNTLMAIAKVLVPGYLGMINLFGSVGEDDLGNSYRQEMRKRGIRGPSQTRGETGITVCLYGSESNNYRYFNYGAALGYKPNLPDLLRLFLCSATGGAVITDVYSLINLNQTERVLKLGRIFPGEIKLALNLGGVKLKPQNPNEILKMILALPIKPMYIFGNEFEFTTLSGEPNPLKAIERITQIFRGASLIAETLEEEGSLVFIKGSDSARRFPSKSVEAKKIVNPIGAGDAFMGTMLAILSQKGFNLAKLELKQAIVSAAKNATLVIQQQSPHL